MSVPVMRHIVLPAGEKVPVLGQGTWHMAEVRERRQDEIAALRLGLDLGLTLVDTAEMYADGEAERLVGEAIAGRRDEVFLVSKVVPAHATRRGTIEACEASLRRLNTDRIDLYLLHWRGSAPLWQTVEAFVELRDRKRIRYWGVSNFDVMDLLDLSEAPLGRDAQTDQVLYNLARRGLEYDLLPRCRAAGMPLMAYSPVDHGRLLEHPAVRDMADAKGVTPAQLALAWVLRLPEVFAVVKASTPARVTENRAAMEIGFSPAELEQLDRMFPPPSSKVPLEML